MKYVGGRNGLCTSSKICRAKLVHVSLFLEHNIGSMRIVHMDPYIGVEPMCYVVVQGAVLSKAWQTLDYARNRC